jgi:phosphate transport system permease protein
MISSRRNSLSLSVGDARLGGIAAAAALAASALFVLIVVFVFKESWPALRQIDLVRFLFDPAWHPTEGLFGLTPMLAASLAASAGALLLATPLGLASALFCHYYAPPMVARLYRWAIVVLSGLPSVVLGLWGLTVVVPLIAWIEPPGASLLAGILILTLMIAPTIALTTEASLAAVPLAYWRGAAALGLSREGAIAHVVLPATRAGIAAGVLLAGARALGETMAIAMVAGNVVQTPTNFFDPVRTLTANIALEMAYATGTHRASLFVSGLLLTALVLSLAASARRLAGGPAHA